MEKHRYKLNPHRKSRKTVTLYGHCVLPDLGKRQDLTPFLSSYTFAIRGTEPSDFAPDVLSAGFGDIGGDGIALKQAVH